MTRQIILDTETTGLDPAQGHRIIEIGAVEMVNRRLTGNRYHQYLNPEREIDAGAIEVHGITNEMLVDKPRFADVVTDFLAFIRGAELIIHNAPFDVGFVNHECRLLDRGADSIEKFCTVLDTLKLARQMHPGQKNDLDSLCRRYSVDNSNRTLHGALLDAEILADVYLAMTGGQTALFQESGSGNRAEGVNAIHGRKQVQIRRGSTPIQIQLPTADEVAAHEKMIADIDKASGGNCLWKKSETASVE